MKIIATIVLLLIKFQLNTSINFEPKQLVKEIRRISGCEKPAFSELKAHQNGKFYVYSNSKPVKYSYIGRVYTCRAQGCKNAEIEFNSNGSEYFDYFILFDSTGKILSLLVFNYEATHGHEITQKSWLSQFVGFNGTRKLIVGKDVDAISGATTSATSITNDIVDKTGKLKRLIEGNPLK